jgi:arsenite-transporting ATPase
MMGSMMQDLAFAIPGVDEAMSFAEIMKSVSDFCLRRRVFNMSAIL